METFDDVTRYCFRVASTVGILLVRLLGHRSPRALDYAEAMGIAVQLTNILRDVGEDAAAGRVYLAREDMRTLRREPGVADRGSDARRAARAAGVLRGARAHPLRARRPAAARGGRASACAPPTRWAASTALCWRSSSDAASRSPRRRCGSRTRGGSRSPPRSGWKERARERARAAQAFAPRALRERRRRAPRAHAARRRAPAPRRAAGALARRDRARRPSCSGGGSRLPS